MAAGLEDRTILMNQFGSDLKLMSSLSKLNWVVQKIVNNHSYFHYVIKHMSTLASLKTDCKLYIIMIVTAATDYSLT